MIKELKIRVLPKQASSEYNITQAVITRIRHRLIFNQSDPSIETLDRRPAKTGYDQHAIKSIYQ